MEVMFSLALPSRLGRASAVIIAMLFGGCAVGPHYTAPDTDALAPAAYPVADASLSSTTAEDRWWIALGDPLLDELVDRALAGNPDLAAAEAHVQQSRAFARVAGATFYPRADVIGRVGNDRLSLNGETLALVPFTPATVQFTDYRIGFDVSWEIDLAGHTQREVEAAVARFGSSTESRNEARLVVSAEVAGNYVAFRTATERLALAQRVLDNLDETLRLVSLEAHAGLASDVDVAGAQADRLNAESALRPLEAAARTAIFQLAALTGDPLDALAKELEAARPIPAVPTVTPVGLPSELLRRRPDVRRAERDLAAATADVGSAVADQFPRLSLVGEFGWDSVRSADLLSQASRYWNVGPQLTLPLFAGGRLRGQVDAAEAGRNAVLATYRATVLRALADTESSLVHFATERSREAALAEAVTRLEKRLSLERRRFQAGDASWIDVLVAERIAVVAADLRASSDGQLAQDYIAVGKALGGGWQIKP